MKVLVTGAGGFIGSHLVELLVEKGYDVTALVHYNSGNHWGWLEGSSVLPNVRIVAGDVRDFDCVMRAADGVEGVFHLAALIGIPYSYESPLAYVRTNVEGTYNIVEAARRLDLHRVLVTSTSEVYGTARKVPINEGHPLQPQSPYSASKIGADNIALSYFHSFGTPIVVARPFNTFGPRQSARAIIPSVAIQLLGGRDEIRLGNLDPTRDLTYVRDTVEGMERLFRADGAIGRAINIGSAREISIRDLAQVLMKITGREARIVADGSRIRKAGSEVERLFADVGELKSVCGWAPTRSFEDGLRLTISWLEKNLSAYKADIYNV